MSSLTQEEWLRKYQFTVYKDFEIDGKRPAWGDGHPKTWGQEDSLFNFSDKHDDFMGSIHSALSPDQKLLAVSKDNILQIYSTISHGHRQTIRHSDKITKVFFHPHAPGTKSDHLHGKGAGYLLGTVTSAAVQIWDLDAKGRMLDEPQHIDARALAIKAMESIKPELRTCDWSDDDAGLVSLRAQFEEILVKADTAHAGVHAFTLDGTVPTYTEDPFNSDGSLLLYIDRSAGKSDNSKAPRVDVLDVNTWKKVYTLSGHTDNIMWAGFSPNNKHVGTCAWDGTLRMYNAADGKLDWIASPGGQTWTAAFSPDSKHIMHSGENGSTVKMYSVQDGKLETTVIKARGIGWYRNIQWHPSGSTVAISNDDGWAFTYDPFSNPPKMLQSYLIRDLKERLTMETVQIKWIDNGRKLAARCNESSLEIWDPSRNVKWRMARPAGTLVSSQDDGAWFLPDGRLMVVDGDSRVRYWTLT